MSSETEVIACPACKHLVRVPLDWLGTQVQCPECQAMFRAPIRVDGKLTDAELLSRPESAPAAPKSRTSADLMLLLPAFGLLLCGLVGAAVNGWLLFMILSDPAGGREWAAKQAEAARKIGQARRAGNIGRLDPALPARDYARCYDRLARSQPIPGFVAQNAFERLIRRNPAIRGTPVENHAVRSDAIGPKSCRTPIERDQGHGRSPAERRSSA